jgi:tetratricopeptide (TPR) repeat protein
MSFFATARDDSDDTGTSPNSSDARPDLFRESVILTRERHFDEALDCLAVALENGDCTQAEALDLDARIAVQQGHLLHAEACWTRAQAEDPSNAKYASALLRLRKRASRSHNALLTSAATAVVLAAVLSGVAVAWWRAELLAQAVAEQSTRLAQLEGKTNRLATESELHLGHQQLAAQIAQLEVVIRSIHEPVGERDAALDELQRTITQSIERQTGHFDQVAAALATSSDVRQVRASLKASTNTLGQAIAGLKQNLQKRLVPQQDLPEE